jgi:tetratricopeptide (TPR) repeat protein
MEPKTLDSAATPLFFISYRGVQPDVKWAYWVAWQLEEKYGEGSCMIQAWDFDPNGNFIKGMQKGATCSYTIAIVSPNYFTSDYTEDEWTAAFKDRKLIVLKIAACEPPGLLSPMLFLSLHEMDEASGRKALLEYMERILAFAKTGRTKPDVPPVFPGIVGTVRTFTSRVPCNVPHPLTGHFVRPGVAWGKLKDSAALESQLPSNRKVCVLYGLHGNGKTQAACAFAWEYRLKYSAILWVRGDSKEVLRASFGGLCGVEALDLPEQHEQDAENRVTAVRRWLKEHSGWLLIADNIDTVDARDALLEWVSPSFAGTVVTTSCMSDWPPICDRIEFCAWHFSLCAEFFIKRLGLPRDDWPIVAFMGNLLGGLPLALEQAASYMEQTRTPLVLYLSKLLEDVKGELARHTPGSTKYPASFAAVVKQSLLRLSPEALFLLEMASFLAPKGQLLRIYETIVNSAAHVDLSKHRLRCPISNADAHTIELNRWSLVVRHSDEFDVHPLVQIVVRDTLSRTDRENHSVLLMRLFFSRFAFIASPVDSGHWRLWNLIFPHMEAFASHIRADGDMRARGHLLNSMGLYLASQGLEANAVALLSEAVAIAEATLGSDHSDTAASLSNLGELLASIGRAHEAKPILLRAVSIVEKSKPLVPHGESSCWNNLGLCYQALGEREAAEAAFRKALALDLARGGSDDDFGLMHQNNFALLLDDDLKQAEEAERIYRNVVGKIKDEVRLAAALTNLGALLYRTHRAREAVTVLEQATKILLGYFPSNHFEVRRIALHLAVARKKVASV